MWASGVGCDDSNNEAWVVGPLKCIFFDNVKRAVYDFDALIMVYFKIVRLFPDTYIVYIDLNLIYIASGMTTIIMFINNIFAI